MFKIIQLSRKDINDLADIDYDSGHQCDRKNKTSKLYMKKELLERFDECRELFFGYKENKTLIGYVTIKPFFPGHKHCEVYWLAVRKAYQGKGIGTKLMEFIESYAKKKGFRAVYVYTNKTMSKTREFYEKLGYKLVNEFPNYYGYKRNNTAVLYGKSI